MTGNKIRVDFFKGITPEQKAAILATQQSQREEAQRVKEKQREKETDWAVKDIANRRNVALLDRANARAAKERALLVSKENEIKALQDKARYVFAIGVDCVGKRTLIRCCTRTRPRRSFLRSLTPRLAKPTAFPCTVVLGYKDAYSTS